MADVTVDITTPSQVLIEVTSPAEVTIDITVGTSGGGGGTGTVTQVTATNGTGQTWTITNPTTTPNLSLALTKSAVGLSNVDNTSDANKPVSTAQAAADSAVLSSANSTAASLATSALNSANNYTDTEVAGKQNTLTLTTTGSSGAATLVGATLNIPQYAGGTTNLGYTPAVNDGAVTSSTGTSATIPAADATNAGLFLASEKTKLSGIEAGAEVNNISDANATDLTDGGDTSLHTHDGRYYTDSEVDTLLSAKQNTLPSNNVSQWTNDAGYKTSENYSITLLAGVVSTLTDSQTLYFGGNAATSPGTTAALSRVYIPVTGTLNIAYITAYCTTAGSNEGWAAYVRLNDTTDTLIQNLASNATFRVWNNNSLGIAVTAGDYIEIKLINPVWATNPASGRFGGNITITV